MLHDSVSMEFPDEGNTGTESRPVVAGRKGQQEVTARSSGFIRGMITFWKEIAVVVAEPRERTKKPYIVHFNVNVMNVNYIAIFFKHK